MKKFQLFCLAVVAAFVMGACTSTSTEENVNDTITEDSIEECIDGAIIDSLSIDSLEVVE